MKPLYEVILNRNNFQACWARFENFSGQTALFQKQLSNVWSDLLLKISMKSFKSKEILIVS